MSMTLEDAIARCEKIVKEAKKSYEVPVADGIMAEVGMELTKKGIEEYQQYTEWLKELKAVKDLIRQHDEDSMPEDFWYIDEIREAVQE